MRNPYFLTIIATRAEWPAPKGEDCGRLKRVVFVRRIPLRVRNRPSQACAAEPAAKWNVAFRLRRLEPVYARANDI
jgi:hypothetical protein